MNQITPPPKIEIIPSSAPFSEAQRSWLNGFFAGLLTDAPRTVERLLKAYLAHRSSPEETFLTFARRHDGETLRKLADAEVSS